MPTRSPEVGLSSLAWVHDSPVVTRAGLHAVDVELVGPGGARRLVAVDPGLHVTDISWADDALAGRPATARLGTRQAWWSWHLDVVLQVGLVAGGLLLVAVIGLVVAPVLGRRRRRTDR